MKTSKIIFITLLSTIAFLILAATLDVRINGRRKGDFRTDFKVNKQVLHSFKVLSINNCMNVTLVQNDSSSIEMTCHKDSIPPKLNYTMKEDTLMFMDFEKKNHRNVSVQINATDSLKWILLKNSDINTECFGSGKLSLNLDRSSLWLYQNKTVKSSCQALDIVAKNHSSVNTSAFRIDSLGIVLINSKADIRINARKISGSLFDNSRISTRQPQEISLKRDATSKISVDDY